MNYKTIKYCILVFLGLLTIKRHIHFGDYCTGMPDGLAWILFSFLFLLFVIIYFIIDIYRKKFDKYVVIIFTIVVALNIGSLTIFESVFSKSIYLKGIIQKEDYRDKHIELYKNKTFKIEIKEIEWSCYFKGEYEIKKDSLILSKENLSEETEYHFTKKYRIDLKNQVLIPFEKEFDTIKITNTND